MTDADLHATTSTASYPLLRRHVPDIKRLPRQRQETNESLFAVPLGLDRIVVALGSLLTMTRACASTSTSTTAPHYQSDKWPVV
jgi:hypothetical protein